MTAKTRLIILDIGSHKLEELQVLLCPFPRQAYIYAYWFIRQVVKFLLKWDVKILSNLKNQVRVIGYYFLSSRRYDLTIVSIDPNPTVALAHVARLAKKYRIIFIPAAVLGHDIQKLSDLKMLYTYSDSISSSLYKKNIEMNGVQKNLCVGLKLSVIWNGLLREGIVSADSEVVLRMNCEGAELGVLLDCEDLGLRLKCVIGSIGDIEKIHGQASGEVAKKIINKMGIKYQYFKGDDPATWLQMAEVWEENTNDYILREA